jgi:AraC-like DNA-binding protein
MLRSVPGSQEFGYYAPKPPLSRFVDLFWFWKGYDLQAGRERCLPTGSSELVISLEDFSPEGAVLCGARSESFLLERTAQDHLFGIHFHPGGIFPFLGVPACELEGTNVHLDDLWPGESERIRSRLLEAPTAEKRFQVMESWLLSRLELPMVRHPAVSYALSQLKTAAGARVSDLADEVSLSQRRFIEVFKQQVGLPPKLYGRVMRFQRIISELASKTEVDWTDLALEHGYFDQAHFIHEFKAFSGLTPTEYLPLRTGHLNHVSA